MVSQSSLPVSETWQRALDQLNAGSTEDNSDIIKRNIQDNERGDFLAWWLGGLRENDGPSTLTHVKSADECIRWLKRIKWSDIDAVGELSRYIYYNTGQHASTPPIFLQEDGPDYWHLQLDLASLGEETDPSIEKVNNYVTELRVGNSVFGHCFCLGKLIVSREKNLMEREPNPTQYMVVVDIEDANKSLWIIVNNEYMDQYSFLIEPSPWLVDGKPCMAMQLMYLTHLGGPVGAGKDVQLRSIMSEQPVPWTMSEDAGDDILIRLGDKKPGTQPSGMLAKALELKSTPHPRPASSTEGDASDPIDADYLTPMSSAPVTFANSDAAHSSQSSSPRISREIRHLIDYAYDSKGDLDTIVESKSEEHGNSTHTSDSAEKADATTSFAKPSTVVHVSAKSRSRAIRKRYRRQKKEEMKKLSYKV